MKRKGLAAITMALLVLVSGCDAASALRHEDEVAQSVTQPPANNGGAAVTLPATPASAESSQPGNQLWVDSEQTNTQCGDSEQTLTGIRAGRHEGYDRIVFDLTGESKPCFRIFFDPNPIQDGSGNPVALGGNYQALRVEISGLGPDFPTIPPGYSAQLSGPNVSYAFFDTFFEGVATNLAVHSGAAQFSVQFIPGKLIVDVRAVTT